MRRRKFIIGLGSVVGWSFQAGAQQAAIPKIGFLHAGSLDGFANQTVAFRQGLKEVGLVAGENVAMEYRWAAGHYDRLPALAADLVNRQVMVMFAGGGPISVRAIRAASATMPIVFTSAFDPTQIGLVKSLSHPGGNMTGVSFAGRDLGPKRLELIHELLPQAKEVTVLQNQKYPLTQENITDLQTGASSRGLQMRVVSASTVAEVEQVFVQLGEHPPDALLLNIDLFFISQRELLVTLAARYRIPTFYPSEEFTRAGGLISYSASLSGAYRRAGSYAGRILKGTKPAELPVVLPDKFDLVINLKTAKALGLNVPESFILYRADEVIE